MVVGPSGGGKTENIDVLSDCLNAERWYPKETSTKEFDITKLIRKLLQ